MGSVILTLLSIDGRRAFSLVLKHWRLCFGRRKKQPIPTSLAGLPPFFGAAMVTAGGPGDARQPAAGIGLAKTVFSRASFGVDSDSGQIAVRKAAVRKLYTERRRQMAPAARHQASETICRQLLALPEVLSAPILALYLAFDNEVNIDRLIAEFGPREKKVLVPRFNRSSGDYEMVEIENVDSDTAKGHFGIREPRAECSAMARSELSGSQITWLIPGVAFDLAGRRLGRGAGFYDRLLGGLLGCRIGIAYDWQLVLEVPAEEHDQAMDLLLSEQRVIRLARAS